MHESMRGDVMRVAAIAATIAAAAGLLSACTVPPERTTALENMLKSCSAARDACGLSGANSTEFDPATPHPVVALITEWVDHDGRIEHRDAGSDLGGTMRLGAQRCPVEPGTLAARIWANCDG